jgi:hypothetical protein
MRIRNPEHNDPNYTYCVRASLTNNIPVAYAHHVLKGLRSAHALIPGAHAQRTHQFLTRMIK